MTAAIGARLAQALLASQRIDADQLDIALAEQQRHGLSLADALVQLGFVAERDMCGALAELLGLCSVDVRMAEPEPEALAMLPAQHARQLCVLPLRYQPQARTLCVAMARPTDLRAQDQLIAISQGQVAHIDPMLASETDLLQALDRCYGPPLSLDSVLREWRERADQAADDAPAVKLADALIHDAVRQGASDIHLEPEARFVRLRYRVDGVLRPVRSLQQAHWPALLVRLKVMSGLNIAEQRAAQDGRMSLTVSGREVDIRVACLPTLHGENLVLRIFDRGRGLPALAQLATPAQRAQLAQMLARPHGMLLVTGPTGAGKTTTLYAMLAQLNRSEVNIMTLEDPVEYVLPMVRQTPLNDTVKLDFASGVRALMRQDPDIILVGEIRDEATASMALRAAMTGHLVLSTLHTHSALGALPRLLDLRASPDLLAGNLIGVIGQRLLRLLCPDCRAPIAADARARRLLGPECERAALHQAVGCPRCAHSGYRGRQAVLEILPIDAELDALIGQGAPLDALRRHAQLQGFSPLADAARALALSGRTSLDEALRVVDLPPHRADED